MSYLTDKTRDKAKEMEKGGGGGGVKLNDIQ